MSPRPLTRGQRAGLAQVNRALAACAPAVDPAAIRAECEESAAGAERNARQYAAEGSALADDQRRYAAKLRYIADALRDAERLDKLERMAGRWPVEVDACTRLRDGKEHRVILTGIDLDDDESPVEAIGQGKNLRAALDAATLADGGTDQ